MGTFFNVTVENYNVTGTLSVDGNVTADYFFGDGSQLSGIVTSVSDVWVNESGDTMTGNLIMSGANITNVSYLGVGTANPQKELDLIGNLQLEDTNVTYGVSNGVIFKGAKRFLHNYHNPVGNGTIVPIGGNTFVGEDSGNFYMGSTATDVYDCLLYTSPSPRDRS